MARPGGLRQAIRDRAGIYGDLLLLAILGLAERKCPVFRVWLTREGMSGIQGWPLS